MISSPSIPLPVQSLAEALNKECFCITLNRPALHAALLRESGNAINEELIEARPNLFSNTPMFVSSDLLEQMLATVRAIELVVRLPEYRDEITAWSPAIARHHFGPLGVIMGYDFHLSASGPRLIEINTNAGGAFLNAALASAQRACCIEMESCMELSKDSDKFDSTFWNMFLNEWRLAGRSGVPARVAIVDEKPEEQYLYPEFQLAKGFFERHAVEAVIVDAASLDYDGKRLLADGKPVDMIYNRLVDFPLDNPAHAALRRAYLDEAIVLTPHPGVHALLADKRNLIVLSDRELLASWGIDEATLTALNTVLKTEAVTPEKAEKLWARRKQLFFKPAAGYGGKAVYRGDKLTLGTWEEIIKGGYVAQEFAPPSERMIEIDGKKEARKADIRLYTYAGNILLTAARLYQGQTTNFRTPGGGFAPVFSV
ncbi:MAG: hypothetical protein Q8M35_09985 [Pseudohongiella sp.]|jgi:hypothetical protein|nr:hypothetical protein [Pseudohongiella sp.]MDP2380790.1 hypothetical protein [Pseudohongiella sp.]